MIQFTIRDKTSFATFCWILWPSSKLKQIIDSQKGKKLSVYSNATYIKGKGSKKSKDQRKTRRVIVPFFGLIRSDVIDLMGQLIDLIY